MADGGEDTDDSQKTEDPTPKKLEEARKRGQVPMSKEVTTWLMLFVATLVIGTFGPSMMGRISFLMRTLMDQSWQVHSDTALLSVMFELVLNIFGALILPLGVLFVAAIAGPFAQIGPLLSVETIKPKLDKLSPIAGFKRIFSKRSFFEFLKGVLKVSIISAVSYMVLRPFLDGVDHLVDMSMAGLLGEMKTMFFKLMSAVLMVLFVLAGIDLLFQRYTFMQQMRMTKQEIKDEFRQSEGDPHVRSRLRQLRMERSRNRMMQNVPGATVVVTNPTHFAVALKYEPDEMDAPVCVAKGQDLIALKIREIATENDVTIVENPPLARTLFKAMEIDDVIPSEHFKAVAEVISYVFRLKKRL